MNSRRVLLVILASLTAASVHAGPRSSTNYAILTDATNIGGRRATSASYTNDGSAGGIAGISTVAAPAETVKHGYIGQLYEVTGLLLSAAPTTVNEDATRQLSAAHFLDDATTLAVNASSVVWSVASGPLASISATGLATAGTVYESTNATAQGILGTFTGTLQLSVLNVNIDDFHEYAADGIDDAWQVQYFGQPPNANAGSLVDFDRDGHANAFEYIAGLNPLDPNSRFILKIAPVPGQPGQKNLIFSPHFTDRTYVVKAKSNLLTLGGWGAISASAPSDNGTERTITDLNASGPAKFYHVEITKP